jgi:cobalt-zinc-cadmium efflux system outer membrane protein
MAKAVEIALRESPQLAGYPLEFQAAEGRTLQASLRPNPELSVDLENAWWNYPGTSRAETTYSISQPLEIGKRSSRVRKAEAETEVLRHDYAIARIIVTADVKRAFVNFLSAAKKLDLNREGHRIATLLATAVSDRVAAGAVSPIEETRAKVALAVSSAEVERTARELEAARRVLAAAMGEATPSFDAPSGELDEDLSAPSVDNLAERIAASPYAIRWAAERERRSAALNVERRLAVPDVTLKGGIRSFRETSENAVVLGFTVPLPLFHRNQGAIREAKAQKAKADVERKSAMALLQSQAGELLSALAAASREASLLRNEALPAAQSAHDAVSEGYHFGKFRYLDVLDTMKSLIETRLRYLESLTALNLARVDLERLIAYVPGNKTPTDDQGASR